MLHMLCGHSAGVGECVRAIHELVSAIDEGAMRRPVNDQACLRFYLHCTPHLALSIAARDAGRVYSAALIDLATDKVVSSSAVDFGRDEIPRLLEHIRSETEE